MKSYLAYQNSDLPWMEELPKHWKFYPLWTVAKMRNEKNPGNLNLLSVFLHYGVIPYHEGGGIVHAPSEDLGNYQVVRPGYLVLNNQQAWRGSVGVSTLNGIISPAYLVFELSKSLDSIYANYLFRAQHMVDQFVLASRGVGSIQRQIHFPSLRMVIVPIPPLDEQQKIGKFLEAKLADIDRYIAEKERLIELLQEQKTALINQAVTRGLNPLARMKSSGIEWLGKIPEHWEVKRNKLIFREIIDRSATGNETRLSMSQKYGLVASDTLEAKTLQSESSEGFKVCQVNDLVLNRLKAHLGVFSRSTIPGSVSPDYTVLRLTTKADVRYFEYLFRHPAYIGWFNKVVRGIIAGFWRLYTQDFLNIASIFPPPEEQKLIVEYIIAETNTIKQSIETLEKEISLMQEYRTALIAEAVTGKIRVAP